MPRFIVLGTLALAACTLDFASFHVPDGASTTSTPTTTTSASGGSGGTTATNSGGTGGESSGNGGNGGNGEFACGDTLAPSASECPPQCSNNCTDDTCVITCEGKEACKDDELTCPDGWHCKVVCDGQHACEQAVIQCPDELACTLVCAGGKDPCKDANLDCADSQHGSCELTCSGGSTCKDATITCGPNKCTAQCPDKGSKPSMQQADSSCEAQDC